jgi:hypothetical protein
MPQQPSDATSPTGGGPIEAEAEYRIASA